MEGRTIATKRTSWPTEIELDLLRAGLLPDDRARAAWNRWRASSGGLAGPEALRLLPLADWNLRRIAGQAAPAGGVPGFLEQEWLGCQRLLDQVNSALLRLARFGVRPLLFKGVALSELFYPLRALRPVGDVDLLVGPEKVPAARAAVEDLGFELAVPEPDSRVAHLHAVTYTRRDSPALDLHARALLECPSANADEGLFARAVSLEIAGSRAATLSAADHLLCVCVHGLRWSAAPAIHWVADAVMIVRSAGSSLAWETLVAEARRRRVSPWVARALRLIRTDFDAPVPEEVLAALAADASGWRERLELASWMRPPALTRGLFLHWCGLAREHPELSAVRRIGRFPRYLRELWGLDRIWQVPFAAARKGALRLGVSRAGG